MKDFYRPEDLAGFSYEKDLGDPGSYPFTRGIYSNMYKGKLWTMRQYAGYGDAKETNRRFHYLLKEGQTGLSVAFDLPTQLGYDSDSPRALGEVGKVGVAISTIDDMGELFLAIPLEQVSTSMTINATAPIILAMYVAIAHEANVGAERLSGTVQNDILKEFVARGNYIFPVRPSMKLAIDIWEYAIKHLPRFYFVSISGYHIREAGATAVEELAFTFANGISYIEEALKRGLNIDEFGPRLSFFFGAHNNFFEEIAKFRAGRRLWAKIMRERFGAKDPKSWMMRFHTQTCGSTLTAHEPANNIIRVTLQALASILGGTQSLHTNSFDEALALPSEEAVKIALRTQQIIAYESYIPMVADPLGGSYYLEVLTNQIEAEAEKLINEIDSLGGAIKCIEEGFIQKKIEESAYRYQKEIENKSRKIVGVNIFTSKDEKERKFKILRVAKELQRKRAAQLKLFRSRRSKLKVQKSLEQLRKAVDTNENLFNPILECVKNRATLGEICDVLREAYGEYDKIKRS
ncbi:MAG: methylmalonyl-CoA mutase family protein [candidate division WOR-3 bacterium]|nr:methylmalonyl-CoA mutase family protein [candidate division WOR-3 bacterium]